jgi:uncharacterized protein (TIGR02996 family)
MPIWFVYRSPYDGPLSKHVKRLDGADTLLDWFRTIWRPIPDIPGANAYAEHLLGTRVYGFSCLFDEGEVGRSPPETMEGVHRALQAALYIGGEYRGTDDAIQVSTDANDNGLAMYWFTDAFARAHPERVAYLLREEWRLPETPGTGGFRPRPGIRRLRPPVAGAEALYLVDPCSGTRDMADLVPADKVPGIRLVDLVPWLLGRSDREGNYAPALEQPRARLQEVLREGEGLEASFRKSLLEDPTDTATWAAYSDWLAERDRPPAGLHLLELALRRIATGEIAMGRRSEEIRVQVAQHCAAASIPRGFGRFDQWFYFDDVWASGNVDLANALLDYNCRFNVLDDWHVKNECGPDIPAGKEVGPE